MPGEMSFAAGRARIFRNVTGLGECVAVKIAQFIVSISVRGILALDFGVADKGYCRCPQWQAVESRGKAIREVNLGEDKGT